MRSSSGTKGVGGSIPASGDSVVVVVVADVVVVVVVVVGGAFPNESLPTPS
jgi:hypothetical protein